MRKDLDVKLSWMSEENWEKFINLGYLPILAIRHPYNFYKTPIHFPELAAIKKKDLDLEETKDGFWDFLVSKVNPWKLLNKFDVLAHLASASGVIILTEKEEDPFRELLGKFLNCGILENPITEYESGREQNN